MAVRSVLVAAAVLTLAPPAGATTTVTGYEHHFVYGPPGIHVAGDDAGQDVAIRTTTDGGLVVRERDGGPLEADGECERRSASEVTCPAQGGAPLTAISAYLGRGADRAVADLAPRHGFIELVGETGDDTLEVRGGEHWNPGLVGQDGDDHLTGGAGRDYLGGDAGDDVLRGRGGDDHLIGDGDRTVGHDLIDGGRGHDSAEWPDRNDRVAASVPRARGGARGEGDELHSIEDLRSGSGDDVLRGDMGPNTLQGASGADLLLGGAGDDRLDAGYNARGGTFTDAAVDRIGCGPGDDVVSHVLTHRKGNLDLLEQDCETLDYFGLRLAIPRLALGADSVSVEVSCPRTESLPVEVALISHGETLGRSDVVLRKQDCDRRAHITVPLDRPLEAGPPIRVVETRGEDGRAEYRLVRPDAGPSR